MLNFLHNKYRFILFAFLFLVVCFFYFLSQKQWDGEINITNFQECIEAGNPIMESYPRRCRINNEIFIEEAGNIFEKMNLIRLNKPYPSQKIESPLIIEGEARGSWFFEGDFPVVLTDWDGLIIAEGHASAEGEWMTEDFVKFKSKLEFIRPEYGDRGSLILQKDNPSGLPENDDALEIPIYFK